MIDRQQDLARIILKDPAVESLSSFVGIDGTNVTLNSGRILVNLKPLEQRQVGVTEIIRRLQLATANVTGIALYLQPVQDLTVEDRISRTQYQLSLEDPNGQELNKWALRLVTKLQTLPELRDVASDQQDSGLQAELVIDRDTASRLGITPQMIDDTLYDAFGQRQISTIFTQLNQYHAVLEVTPSMQKTPSDLSSIYVRSASGGQVPLSAFTTMKETTAPLVVNHAGAVSLHHHLIRPRAGIRAGRRGDGDRGGAKTNGDAGQYPGLLSGYGGGVPRLADQ